MTPLDREWRSQLDMFIAPYLGSELGEVINLLLLLIMISGDKFDMHAGQPELVTCQLNLHMHDKLL